MLIKGSVQFCTGLGIVVLTDIIAILLTPCLCLAIQNDIGLVVPFSSKQVPLSVAYVPLMKSGAFVIKMHLLPQFQYRTLKLKTFRRKLK